jgi:hypothetical protein
VIVTTASNGSTITRVVFQTQTADSSSPTAAARNSSTPFFQNKGAVAGTFTAVGLVVAILLVFIATRWVRRRREKKFDKEIDQAAAEAAAAGANPDFADDYDYRSNGTGFGAYSEASHGTLAQPPLGHDAYGNLGAASVAEGAGAAGIGVGAMARARSHRSGGADQYSQFSGAAQPMAENYEMTDSQNLRYRRSTGPYQYDPILGGYGAGDDPYAVARGSSVRHGANSGSLSRATSGSASHEQYVNQPGQPFVAPGYPPQQQYQPPVPPLPAAQQQQQQQQAHSAGLLAGQGASPPDDYYGTHEPASGALPNPHSARELPPSGSQAALVHRHSTDDEGEQPYAVGHEEESDDDEGDDEPEHNPRVLRVANE